MSEIAAGARPAWRSGLGAGAEVARGAPDARRALQLGLAGIWLLDALLQYQAFMFSTGFSQMIGGTAAGNPGVVASPITWDATLVAHHAVLVNSIFATIQLLLAIGIAWRPTVRPALAASIAWALGVWWFGEGLGMVLTSSASPVNGAPGAVIIYALLAVLLWPADRAGRPAPFTAARAIGAPVARALWLVLWLSLAYFALLPGNRAPQALNGMIAGMESGEPGWLAALDRGAASLLAHQGLAASIVLAIALVIIAVGVYLPPPATRATLVLAIVVAAVIWVFGQAFGTILTGGGTDPNSGLLLILLALTYWPVRAAVTTPARPPRPRALPTKGRSHHDSRLDPGHLRRGHARGRGGQRGPAGHGATMAAGDMRAALADIDVSHLLMAIAMAGMLVASLQTLPNGAWSVIFAVMTAWFGYRVIRDARVSGVRALAGGHCAPHLIHAGAMLYMFMAFTAPAAHGSGGMSGMGGGMSGMGTLQLPLLAFIFALALIGYSIWDLDQLSGPGASGHYSLAAARPVPSGAVLAGVAAMSGAGPGPVAVAAPAGSQLRPAVAAGSAVASQALPAAACGSAADGTGRGLLAPWIATSCRITMGVTMAFMLLIMI